MKILKSIIKTAAIFTFLFAFSSTAHSLDFTKEDAIGQWKQIIKNPAYKNTVANRYMRHSFFVDGTLVVENKENSSMTKNWTFENGKIIVTSAYDKSVFTEWYEFVSIDEL